MRGEFHKPSKAMPPGGAPSLLARTRGWVRRLNSPEDTQAAAFVAALLLCAEAVLCGVIIARVSCKHTPSSLGGPLSENCVSNYAVLCYFTLVRALRAVSPCASADTPIDWEAYMEQVEGFLSVRHFTLHASPFFAVS